MKPIVFLMTLALAGCATHQKTYHPPSATKITASSQRVSTTVTKAQTTAAKAREHVRAAKSTAADAAAVSAILEREAQDVPNVPQGLLNTITRLRVVEGVLTSQLFDANQTHDMLFHELGEAQQARVQLQKDQVDYIAQAQVLADSATSERDSRIKAEKALSWYRWHSWLMKIATGAGILIVIFVVFLWVTGRLAGLAAKFV